VFRDRAGLPSVAVSFIVLMSDSLHEADTSETTSSIGSFHLSFQEKSTLKTNNYLLAGMVTNTSK
jgi:hypothetical protein